MRHLCLILMCLLVSACGTGLRLEADDGGVPSEVDESITFAGVDSVRLTASSRLAVSWDAAVANGSVTYRVYTGTSSGSVTSLQATVSDVTETIVDAPVASVAYVRVTATRGSTLAEDATVTSLNIAANTTHPILDGTHSTTNALDDVYAHDVQQAVAAYGTRLDSYGNIYWSDNNTKRIQVVCVDPSAPGACDGQERDKVYWIAGNGTAAAPTDGALPKVSSISEVRGLTIDASGNIFLADYGAHYVEAICFDDGAPGACFGKTEGRLHIVAGTGVNADGAQNAVATSVAVPRPADAAVDAQGNLYFASYEASPRVRVVCYDVSTLNHFCTGRTAGNVYYYAGTASEGSAADGTAATSGNLGRLFGIEFDSHGNLFLAELRNTGRTVRVVCNYHSGSLAGICASSTAGALYRVLGTGTLGDGGSNAVATSTNVGNVRSVTVDEYGNAWIADASYGKIRVRCADVASSTGNFCEGKTVGNIYTYSSSSWATAGASAISGSGSLEGAHTGSLRFDPSTKNLYYGAGNGLLRVIRPDAP